MSGNLGADGMELGAMLKVITDNNSQKVIGEQIWVDNAKEVTIYVNGTTTFRGGNNIFSYIENNINKAIKYTYNELKSRHISNYQELYNRVKLSLSDNKNNNLTANINNNLIYELYFNFGRYLLISCSRPDCLPANLQGLWNKDMAPAWDSKYTININTEMNYWPAYKMSRPNVQKILYKNVQLVCLF